MRAVLLLLLLWLPTLAAAQGQATLVADALEVTADGRLVASGNVEAFYAGTTLSAARVTYDRGADRLTVEGPILIREAGGAVLAAEEAVLDPRLRDGLLRGARLVLDRQLQLAAGRADRVEGLTALTGVAATSCQVCPGTAPLWEIRAGRIVHDEAAELLHVRDATFRVRGVPILWLPALRLPDPGNERATGLLIPAIRTTDRLGFGVRLPVFVELGDSRDLTLTPYLSARTTTIEGRYRQAFWAGDVLARGALSRDDLGAGDPRGFAALDGAFALGGGVDLAFAGRVVSDDAYLLDYGQSDADRLASTLALTRVGQSSLLVADVTRYQSLREDEEDGLLPPVVASLAWQRRFGAGGGTLTLGAGADAFARTTDAVGGAGRDVGRAGAFADWRREAVVGPGLLLEARGRLALDAFRVADDPATPTSLARAVPAAAATLRWPLLRRGAGGTADLLEPVASLGWSRALGDEPPNEDARLVELDRANLFALDRLPGEDAVEEGARLALGLAWTRMGAGYASTVALGRVLRREPSGLSTASGLAGTASDLLLEGGVELDGGLRLNARTLLGGGLRDPSFGKSEARLDWSNAVVDLSAAYLYLPADPAEDRPRRAAEAAFDAEWRASARWAFGAEARYDLAAAEPARAGLSVGWRNECVEVDVSLSRRYTSRDAAGPSTDLGLSVNLNGFSAGRRARVAPGACRP